MDDEIIDIEKIKTILPHRYPFLLVDKVIRIEKEKIVALKNVSVNEPFFQGHFPNKHVMPGVLIIEAFAQVSAILGYSSCGEEDIPRREKALFYLVGVDKTRFRKPVHPGDQLVINSVTITRKKDIWKYEASAYVDDKKVASAELLTTIVL